MVDPKMVELSVYNALPHLRHKVVTDNRDAAAVLKWAVLEMQERYELLAANGCRNIQDFNQRVQDRRAAQDAEAARTSRSRTRRTRGGILPYIVVVIDELADLMMTVQGEVETPLAMLAQKARAIGIHLILATQRPSVNVITGLIKANFPSRIAFRVASQVDSRTIIDGMGAEMLLGNGDMLFIPPGKSGAGAAAGRVHLERGHRAADGVVRGAARPARARRSRRRAGSSRPRRRRTSRTSSRRCARARRRRARRRGRRRGAATTPATATSCSARRRRSCIQHQQGSTSLLQRRLKIGYGRAARDHRPARGRGRARCQRVARRAARCCVGLEDLDRICGTRASEDPCVPTRAAVVAASAGDRVADRRAGALQHTSWRGRALVQRRIRSYPFQPPSGRVDAHGQSPPIGSRCCATRVRARSASARSR